MNLLYKEDLVPGKLVVMKRAFVKGVAVILGYPFENTVKVLDPNGSIQFTNANYLFPVINEDR